MRDRRRSAKLKVLAIGCASRNKTEQGRQKMKDAYVKLLDIASRVVGQARKFAREIGERVKQGVCRYCTKPRSNRMRFLYQTADAKPYRGRKLTLGRAIASLLLRGGPHRLAYTRAYSLEVL